MIFDARKTATLALLLSLSFRIGASPIPDKPIVAIEPGLETNDRIGGALGWVDDRTLLVTAQIKIGSQFWERKVMRVDARTGKATEVANPGSLVCTNPTEHVAAISVGSEASLYTGDSRDPKPELRLYGWNPLLGSLSPKTSRDGWNLHICQKTKPEDVDVAGSAVFYASKDIRYLKGEEEYLLFSGNRNGEGRSVALIRNGKPVATLQVKATDVAPAPQYLPFRDEYLLTAGAFSTLRTMTRFDEAPTTEYPIVTMAGSGKIKREYVRPLFEKNHMAVDGFTFPYAKGTLIFVPARPKEGGGVYLSQGESIRRVWCVNTGKTLDRQCQATEGSMSPDGCHFAFYAKDSDDPKPPFAFGSSLKILPLCR